MGLKGFVVVVVVVGKLKIKSNARISKELRETLKYVLETLPQSQTSDDNGARNKGKVR